MVRVRPKWDIFWLGGIFFGLVVRGGIFLVAVGYFWLFCKVPFVMIMFLKIYKKTRESSESY